MVMLSEARKTAPRARAMEQLDRQGTIRGAINTIKHAARQSYRPIRISFGQIIDPDLALLLAFASIEPKILAQDGRKH